MEDHKDNLENEIEEILRNNGEEPGKAKRPRARNTFLGVQMNNISTTRLIIISLIVVSTFLCIRIMGLAGLRLITSVAILTLILYQGRKYIKG
jgi:hypothetical protein